MQEGAEMMSLVLADLEEAARGTAVRRAYGDRLAAEMAEVLAAARQAALRRSDPGAPRDGAAPLVQPEVDDVLRLSLRQQLFGPRALVADRPVAGLLRMAVLCTAAVWGARRRAGAAVGAAELGAGHSLAARLLELGSAAAVLVQHEELAPSIFAGLPLLLA